MTRRRWADRCGGPWAFAVLGLSLLGCHARLPALARQGEYAEVIRRAQRSRLRPRRASARAYATALVELGDPSRAMAVLLRDYRKGGEYLSLVALADLERAQGWRSLAAHHYARVFSLEPSMLERRGDVCELFADRARAYLSADEGIAADQDVRRAFVLCPERAASLRELAARTRRAAKALITARSAVAKCSAPNCDPARSEQRAAADEAALREAAASSPGRLHAEAVRLGAQLPATQICDVLLAELRGDLGDAILTEDTLRGLLGAQTWLDLAPTVVPMEPAASAYLQLRLSAVLDVPSGPKALRGADPIERWAERAVYVPRARPWRLHVWRSDPTTAELALSATWRPRPAAAAGVRSGREPKAPASTPLKAPSRGDKAAKPGEGPAKPTGDMSVAPLTGPDAAAPLPEPLRPAHWSAKVPVDEASLADLLAVAWLRAAAGKEDLGLSLARHQLTQAEERGVAGAATTRIGEATRALGWGRPWQALAILEGSNFAEAEPVRAAAATAVLLHRAVCDGPCRDDDDEASATRVLGERWAEAYGQRMLPLALANRSLSGADRTPTCPSAEEYLAPDAVGPVPDALRVAQSTGSSPELAASIAQALASDLRPWCAAQALLPIVSPQTMALWPSMLAESLAHAPQMAAARELLVHAQLAVLAREPRRAQQLIIAAAGEAADPGAVWAEFAAFATRARSRDLAMEGWRETILHAQGLVHDQARRELLLAALEDAGRSWTGTKPVGREALARQVDAYVTRTTPARRWSAIEQLLDSVDTRGILERVPPQQVLAAVLPTESDRTAHARTLGRLTGGRASYGLTGTGASDSAGAFDDSGLSAGAALGRTSAPSELTVLFGRPEAFGRLRATLASNARDWETRRRMAVGIAVLGTPQQRRAGLAALGEMVAQGRPSGTAALEALVVQRPAALEPGAAPGTLAPTSVVAQTAQLIAAVLDGGLDGGGLGATR